MATKVTPELRAHQEWIGFVQPVGLVVSLPALEKAQCYVNRNIIPAQEALRALALPSDDPEFIPEIAPLCREVFGWQPDDLRAAGDRFTVALPEYQDTLVAEYVVADPDDAQGAIALVSLVPKAMAFDEHRTDTGWQASPEARLERLLRETGVPIGVLFNQTALRLVYAPRGESSGHATFSIGHMLKVAGRPILAGLHALLSADRLFNLPSAQRLPAILKESRLYQNVVSTKLSEQVLGALHALLRGFQVADESVEGRLLQDVLREAPNEVYGGLLTTLLRLVFILYAEDRGLLSNDPTYVRHYAIGSLFDKLREDAARYPDTMDQRYGAWSRLLSLFRMVHDGVEHGSFNLPPRFGRVFDPDAYPFLEGRPPGVARQVGERLTPPRISDGIVYRVLDQLLILDGDRLSYRTLDVEQIGSVYEAMMGFNLRVVREQSIGLKGKRKVGGPPLDPIVGLETLLARKPADRSAYLGSAAEVKLTGAALVAVKAASTIEELVAAFGRRISDFTPTVLPPGSMALEATEERRRSGSHYTPRILTEPIVEKTLRPVLNGLGERPPPERILGLKICDPAMGSGAFLVAACRALGDQLVRSWQQHGMPTVPPDEDLVLFARRIVAQRCLYGVDKNPFAVDLAKLSLWLVTLAKGHPFTFLDHALRCGDSLVGLSRRQIGGFHWAPETELLALRGEIDRELERAEDLRGEIHDLAESDDTLEKQRRLRDADDSLVRLRRVGNLVIEAFFSAGKEKARAVRLAEFAKIVAKGLGALPDTPEAERLRAFHWEIEFPEVLARNRPGFDCIVGNPPFSGKNGIASLHPNYLDWLKQIHDGSHGNADLVAHFFRRAFGLLANGGTFGLIATNTIAQGDTRSSGLRWILENGGQIFEATRRFKWPGGAAVIVSIVHVIRGSRAMLMSVLDGVPVARISAFLFHTGPDSDPVSLAENSDRAFVGSYVLGSGFTFDDTKQEAMSLAEMEKLLARDPRNAARIFPYIGGEEVNTSPTHSHHRYVINFGQMTEAQARGWPDLMAVLESNVRPARQAQKRENRARYWWRFGEAAPALYDATRSLERILVCGQTSKYRTFTFLPNGMVYDQKLIVFAFSSFAAWAVVSARIHEAWALFFGSTMKDDPVYTPSDCFETFPFPDAWEKSTALESVGRSCFEYRAALMVRNGQGLTTTYNRFHDPDERDPEILRLRLLHDEVDRAALEAYGWGDLKPVCEFRLDYEDDADADDDSRRKLPWRYSWAEALHDEVLARLLALNATRGHAQQLLGAEGRLRKPSRRPGSEAASSLSKVSRRRQRVSTEDLVDPVLEDLDS